MIVSSNKEQQTVNKNFFKLANFKFSFQGFLENVKTEFLTKNYHFWLYQMGDMKFLMYLETIGHWLTLEHHFPDNLLIFPWNENQIK